MPPSNYSRAPRGHGLKIPLAIQRLALNGDARFVGHPSKMSTIGSMRPRKVGRGGGRHAVPLSGPHGHHGHHGGGRGGRAFIPPFAYGYGYPEPAVAYPDPCISPAFYPPGTCAAVMAANIQRPLSGACCDGCASGSQCSGASGTHLSGVLDMVPGGTMVTKVAVLAGVGALAYILLKR